jgi:subtilase family serine protease
MKKICYSAPAIGLAASLLAGCFQSPEGPEADKPMAVAAAIGLPDLLFTSAAVVSATPTQVNYSYTIKNNGSAGIPDLYNVSIQNFYSANTIFNDAGDAPAGGSILGIHVALAAGASYSGSFHSSGAIPAGMNYLTFKIDWGNAVAESDESNNARALLVRPDLRFTAATVTGPSVTGGFAYAYTIVNQGTVAVPDLYNVSIQNFYSANTVFNDAGDVAAGGSILGVHVALAAGASYSGTFYSSGSLPAGMNYLTFKIDWGDLVAESNEGNNTAFLTVRPDLSFTSVSLSQRTATGVNYTYTIRNNGSVAIPDLYNVSIQNFYSANTVFNDAGDVPAGGSILGVHVALAAGATYSGSFRASGAVPWSTPYLTAKIDWGNIIAESNESNNTFAALIP